MRDGRWLRIEEKADEGCFLGKSVTAHTARRCWEPLAGGLVGQRPEHDNWGMSLNMSMLGYRRRNAALVTHWVGDGSLTKRLPEFVIR